MNARIVRLLILPILVLGCSLSRGEEFASRCSGFYFGVDSGFAFRESTPYQLNGNLAGQYEFDAGYRGDLQVGFRFANGVMLEVEPGYIYNSVANALGSVELRQVPVLLNMKYELPLWGPLALVAGVGAGADFARITGNEQTLRLRNSAVFAWQGKAGVEYAISGRARLGLGYKCISTDNLDFGLVRLNGALTHCAELSFKFGF
jgi:opacity protein-like surface antigen